MLPVMLVFMFYAADNRYVWNRRVSSFSLFTRATWLLLLLRIVVLKSSRKIHKVHGQVLITPKKVLHICNALGSFRVVNNAFVT